MFDMLHNPAKKRSVAQCTASAIHHGQTHAVQSVIKMKKRKLGHVLYFLLLDTKSTIQVTTIPRTALCNTEAWQSLTFPGHVFTAVPSVL